MRRRILRGIRGGVLGRGTVGELRAKKRGERQGDARDIWLIRNIILPLQCKRDSAEWSSGSSLGS